MAEVRIRFFPGRKSAVFEKGITLRDAALALGILIESDCAGIGTCGKCKVEVKGKLNPPTAVEKNLLSRPELQKGIRLSCQALLVNPCTVIVPQSSTSIGDQILTESGLQQTPLNPDIRKVVVELPDHRLGEKYFAFEQLVAALRQKNIQIAHFPVSAVRDLPQWLQQGKRTLTAVIDQNQLLAFEPGDTTGVLFGVAIDIGTTTLAAKLIDLTRGEVQAVASAVNPQRAHGADVIARIHYTIEHAGGLKLLNRLIIRQINELIEKLCARAKIGPEQIYKMTLVGNTVMQHFVLKIDPRRLAYKPYTPIFQGPATVSASELSIRIHPRGVVYFLPNLACFVGSDITGVLTVLDFQRRQNMQLAVDMGTNGEVVIGNRKHLICTSSPAGPAWEGACISWGMPASIGAIERAEIVDGDLQFRTIGEVNPIGICGSGLIDLVCELTRAGVIDPSGRILSPDELGADVPAAIKKRILQRPSGMKEILIYEIDAETRISLTQKDVREVQLAKAAIRTGIQILMKTLEIQPRDLENIYIAGGFGNHVRSEDAIDLGLVPPVAGEKIQFIGNAALAGAAACLRSGEARKKAEALAKSIEFKEIAEDEDFQKIFVQMMQFHLQR